MLRRQDEGHGRPYDGGDRPAQLTGVLLGLFLVRMTSRIVQAMPMAASVPGKLVMLPGIAAFGTAAGFVRARGRERPTIGAGTPRVNTTDSQGQA